MTIFWPMEHRNQKENSPPRNPKRDLAATKKGQILLAWQEGERDLWKIARRLGTQPSYVASTLQSLGVLEGYYDLYTTPKNAVNIYIGMLQGRLGFKDLAAAEESVNLLEHTYHELEQLRDRAGQHHCLVAALTMFNRARFIGKSREADVFRRWILRKLADEQRPSNEVRAA